MHSSSLDFEGLLWFAGWLLAVIVLFAGALRLPLQTRMRAFGNRAYNTGVLVLAIGLVVLANVALSLHDVHFDLTRERVFTPAEEALAVVDQVQRPVLLTYYYQGDDQNGRRAAEIWEVMGRRNPLLQVRALDPDKEPSLAKNAGLKLYNTAVLEADGRRLSVSSTDEIDIAIGIQRVLREKVITACFLEGHQEYPMDGLEIHTHFEGIGGHDHGDSSSVRIQTAGHGVGRLRRALESIGYDVRVTRPAAEGSIAPSCSVVIVAGPRTTFLPDEARALTEYLERGGSMFMMFDLGFVLEPGLADMLATMGMQLPQRVIRDPKSHYGKDAETLAVTSYDPHPITRQVSMTIFPGARPIRLIKPADDIRTTTLVSSSPDSLTVAVAPLERRTILQDGAPSPAPYAQSLARPDTSVSAPAADQATGQVASQETEDGERSYPVLAIAEGRLSAAAEKDFRVAVAGDADFASNSFLPFLANSDLALSLVRWLVREERETAIASRIPVPTLIILTPQQSRWIFIALEILLPVLVLLAGALVYWRRR